MTPRTITPKAFVASIEGRITAMARAHSVLAAANWDGADLRTIAEGEIAVHAASVHIMGPPVLLTPVATQPVAMLLHELITNAAKHGALSLPGGTVRFSWEFQVDGALQLCWAEQGGPTITQEPVLPGFGSRLIASLAEQQLRGVLQRAWLPTGLVLTLLLPPAHAHVMPGAADLPPRAMRRHEPQLRSSEPSRQSLTLSQGQTPKVLMLKSLADLEAAIQQYLDQHNADPKPFVWTASAAAILEKVARGRQNVRVTTLDLAAA